MKKLITLSLLTASLLYATDIDELNKQAIELLKNNSFNEASALLSTEYQKGNFNNQTLFLLGMAAKESGNLALAEKYFEELLDKDATADRVRLELAFVYFKSQKMDRSKELLLAVKAKNPPQNVLANIDAALSYIENAKGSMENQKNWQVSLGVGYMYDSNANAGPNKDNVTIYGLPFTLSNDAKNQSDYAKTYHIDAGYIKDFGNDFAWQTGIGFNVVDYNKINTMDNANGYLSTGLQYKLGNYIFSAPVYANKMQVGHDSYSHGVGISPQVSYLYDDLLQTSLSLGLRRTSYDQDENSGQDANSVMLGSNTLFFLDKTSYIDLGLSATRSSATDDIYTNDAKSISLGYFKYLTQEFSVYAGVSYSKADYEAEQAAYGVKRQDKIKGANAKLNYFIKEFGLNTSLYYTYTDNDSNIEMNTYKRNQVGLNLTKNF